MFILQIITTEPNEKEYLCMLKTVSSKGKQSL